MYIFSSDELQEASKALSDVLEHDLPKMQKAKPEHVSPTSSNICDRCGRNLYASPDEDNWITCTLLLKAISCRNWYIIYLPWIFRNAFSSNCCFFLFHLLFNKIKILISIWIFLFLGLITINALMKGYYKTISLCIFNRDQLFIL